MLVTSWFELVWIRVVGFLIRNAFAIRFAFFHLLEVNWEFLQTNLFGIWSPKALIVIHTTNNGISLHTVLRVFLGESNTTACCIHRWFLTLIRSISFSVSLKRKNLYNEAAYTFIRIINNKPDQFFYLALIWFLVSDSDFECLHLNICINRIFICDVALLTVIYDILTVYAWLQAFTLAFIEIEIRSLQLFYCFDVGQFSKTGCEFQGFLSSHLVIKVLPGTLHSLSCLVKLAVQVSLLILAQYVHGLLWKQCQFLCQLALVNVRFVGWFVLFLGCVKISVSQVAE